MSGTASQSACRQAAASGIHSSQSSTPPTRTLILNPTSGIQARVVTGQRPHLVSRLHPTQVDVPNHPPMIEDPPSIHEHVALDKTGAIASKVQCLIEQSAANAMRSPSRYKARRYRDKRSFSWRSENHLQEEFSGLAC